MTKKDINNKKVKEFKIKVNRAKCKNCNTVIESLHRHHFQPCKCWKNEEDNLGIFVDGGLEYLRRGGNLKNIIELSEYK